MQELVWIDHLPNSRLDEGIALANELYWAITVFQGSDNHWYVKAGEKVIFKTDTEKARDAFLYGLGLAYSVLPPEVFTILKEEVRKWAE